MGLFRSSCRINNLPPVNTLSSSTPVASMLFVFNDLVKIANARVATNADWEIISDGGSRATVFPLERKQGPVGRQGRAAV